MSTIADLVNPGEGLRGLFRMFQGGVGDGPLVEPGTYTLTMKMEDRTFTQTIEIDRVGEYRGQTSPFQTDR